MFFENHEPPYLGLITEPESCDSKDRMRCTVHAIKRAVSTQKVTLVSIRVVYNINENANTTHDDFRQRVVDLAAQVVELSKQTKNGDFSVVISSDWIQEGLEAGVDGVHVKERHRAQIPNIRSMFAAAGRPIPLIGTSAHDVESALDAWHTHRPNYLFVGTCYPTASHPEKSKLQDLEGPELPGQVQRALQDVIIQDVKDKRNAKQNNCIPIFAIGGINKDNCWEPIRHGASGVATIRAILCASDPAVAVNELWDNMKTTTSNIGQKL